MPDPAKLVLITGGGSGMGREAARRFAERGETVALFDVNVQGMAETRGSSDRIHCWTVDITDFAAVCAAVKEVEQTLGPIERLYNCAAIMPFGKLLEQDNAIIHKQMAINYGGLVNITQAVLPGMLARKQGKIVHIASLMSELARPSVVPYTAAKGGVLAAIARWGTQQGRPVPVYFIGVGETMEDLQTFNALEFAQALVA